MTESFQLSTILPTTPKSIYHAWLNGGEHGTFTGSHATVDPRPGGKFTAWDGYIWGTNLELEMNRRILQSWRTSDFPEDSEDSRLEILLEEVKDGTKVTLIHTQIPEGQGEEYRRGWEEWYFEPMNQYFSKQE